VRLIGVDCPEMHYPTAAEMLATLRLKDFMSPDEAATVEPAIEKIADRLNGAAKLITEMVKRPVEGKEVELAQVPQFGA
jgi:hypothetical protein